MGSELGMQSKKILGVTISLLTLRESLNKSDFLLENVALSTAHYITSRMLVQASKQPELKALLENTDLLICAETDILRAAGINSKARQYEIDNHLYLKEQCRHIHRNQGNFYLLSDSNDNLQSLQKILSDYLGNDFSVTGQTLDHFRGSNDILVPEILANELNNIAPVMIISNLMFPYQLQLMHDLKPFLNARMWLGLPHDITFLTKRRLSVFKKLHQKYFNKKVHQYEYSEQDELSNDKSAS